MSSPAHKPDPEEGHCGNCGAPTEALAPPTPANDRSPPSHFARPKHDPARVGSLSLEESRRLARLAHAGNTAARDRMVASCEGTVLYYARRYAWTSPHLLDDLISEARLSVLRAVDKYDPDRGMKFSSYAVFLIKNSCRMLILDQRWAVNLPRSKSSRENEASRNVRTESLIRIGDDGEEYELPLAAEQEHESDVLFREKITALLHILSTTERTILMARFFDNETCAEVGRRLGYSREWIRQLEVIALKKLREALGVKDSPAAPRRLLAISRETAFSEALRSLKALSAERAERRRLH